MDKNKSPAARLLVAMLLPAWAVWPAAADDAVVTAGQVTGAALATSGNGGFATSAVQGGFVATTRSVGAANQFVQSGITGDVAGSVATAQGSGFVDLTSDSAAFAVRMPGTAISGTSTDTQVTVQAVGSASVHGNANAIGNASASPP
ncbi:MAG: hypothetical protein OEQ18_02940 [Gammaproteobacteria bacterium]|nr:hypothetical protein [Gammaproteobacteria bacterium]